MRCASLVLLLIGAMTPGPARAAEPSAADRRLIVSGQGYFPVAVRLQDQRIAVVMRGGGPHLSIHGRLDIVFSSDEGKTWSKPAVVVDSPADDRNPAFGQATDGTLVVAFWRTARYAADGQYAPKIDKPVNTWVTRSADGGKTWSDPREIDVTDIGWGSPYGRMLTQADGTMLMAVYGGQERSPGKSPPPERRTATFIAPPTAAQPGADSPRRDQTASTRRPSWRPAPASCLPPCEPQRTARSA